MKNDTSTDSLTALIYNFAKQLSFYYYNYPDSQNQISVTIYLHNFDLHNLR